MTYLGDFSLGKTFDIKFCTVAGTGAPTVLAGSPVISAYVDNSTTQLTAGITLSVDFDSVVGLNNVRVVATSGNGYAAGGNYQLVITTGTVGGVSVVGYVVAQFSIEARSSLRPTTADRTLDVSAGGEAGMDWANIGSPTTAQNLSATNIDVDQVVASVAGAVGSVTGAVGSVTGAVGSVAAGGITAASLAADAITAAKIAADAVTEIQSGLATAAALTVIDDFLDTEIAGIITTLGTPAGVSMSADIAAIEAQTDDIGIAGAGLTAIADQVWDEVLAGHLGAGSTGEALNAAGAAGDPWTTALPGAYGAGSAGKIIGDNVNATISSRASQTSVDTIDDFLDTEIAAIKAKTDNLPTDPADESSIQAVLTTIAGYIDTEVGAIKAVTDALPNGGALTTIQSDLDDIQLRLPAALVSGRMDSNMQAAANGVITAAVIATDAFDSDALAANAITEIQNGLATAAALAIVAGYIDTEIGTLQTDVSAILADTGTDGVIVVAASKTGYALSAAGVDEIFDELRAGHSVAGSYGESFFTLESGAAIAGTLSTTQMSTNLTEATDDHYKGRIVIWVSGALLRQATDITAYNGTTKVLTFTALTEAPSAADKFIIV